MEFRVHLIQTVSFIGKSEQLVALIEKLIHHKKSQLNTDTSQELREKTLVLDLNIIYRSLTSIHYLLYKIHPFIITLETLLTKSNKFIHFL